MEMPTIVKQTKEYLRIKVPLPASAPAAPYPVPRTAPRGAKMTTTEKRLWGIIQDGEREYREGKTIRARSIDGALKIHARKEN